MTKANLQEFLKTKEVIVDEFLQLIENLRHDVYLFYKAFSNFKSKYHFFQEDIHQRNRLQELLQDMNTISTRIQADIDAIKQYQKSGKALNKKQVDTTNSNLKDLLSNYEITIVKFQRFEAQYHSDLQQKVSDFLLCFVNSIEKLDNVISDFNDTAQYELLQPFEESIIANKIHQFGFQTTIKQDLAPYIIYR